MHCIRCLLSVLLACTLAACSTTAARFPGTVVQPPVDLAGRWQMTLGDTTSVFVLTPAAGYHYNVTSPTAAGAPVDASIQAYRGAHYLVVADPAQAGGFSVFRVQGAAPDQLRIAALDPARTEAVLKARGLPVIYRKMWLYEEIALSGPALEAVLAVPADDIFALGDAMTLRRQ